MEKKEYILCAAIWYKDQPTSKQLPVNIDRGVVVCGHRHADCLHTFVALTGKRSVVPECGQYEQGFITNFNDFVSRETAAIIAKKANQIISFATVERLYSEDLY